MAARGLSASVAKLLPTRRDIFRRVVGAVLDVTATKQVEKALEASQTELKTLAAHQSALLDAIPDIIAEVDNDKRYTWLNPVGLAFFGEDAIGHPASEYFEGKQETYQTVQPVFDGNDDVVYI